MLVYELIDPFDNIIKYVGISKWSANQRFNTHLKDAKTHLRKHAFLSKKEKWILELHKLGTKPIIRTVEKNLSEDEAIKMEAELIAKYGRHCEGGQLFNVQEGGYYDSCKAKVWNKGIHNCYTKKMIEINRKHQPNKKIVYRFDINGNLIDTWDSIRRMCSELHFDRRAVMRCLKGEENFKSHKKYMFSHDSTSPIYHNNSKDLTYNKSPHAKKIKASKKDFYGEFQSIKEAGEKLNIPAAYISAVLIGKQKTAHGYNFQYLI